MKRLLLLRHAKTEPWYEGVDDRGRALTPSGHKTAIAMANLLVDRDLKPDVALVSTARRTRETWRHISEAFGGCEVKLLDDLYLASMTQMESVITTAEGSGTVLVVGHNPGIQDLAIRLMRDAGTRDDVAAQRVVSKFPTAALAIFEASEGGPFIPVHFRLSDYVRPHDLGEQD